MAMRDLNFRGRKENTREKFTTDVVCFSNEDIYCRYKTCIDTIVKQFDVAEELLSGNKIEEAHMIWRTQIILLASALDFYFHELTKIRLCQMYTGELVCTEKYCNIQVDMNHIEKGLNSEFDKEWFLDYINRYYERITMVSYESIKEQCNLLAIDLKEVAKDAFYVQGDKEKTSDKLKQKLTDLFHRRNIIAHQTDRKHANAELNVITREEVEQFIDDIDKIVGVVNEKTATKGN